MDAFFRRFKVSNSSAAIKVRILMKTYPNLIYIENVNYGPHDEMVVQLVYERVAINNILKTGECPDLTGSLLPSLERSLKHNGLKCVETTHGGRALKKWMFIDDIVRIDRYDGYADGYVDGGLYNDYPSGNSNIVGKRKKRTRIIDEEEEEVIVGTLLQDQYPFVRMEYMEYIEDVNLNYNYDNCDFALPLPPNYVFVTEQKYLDIKE